MMRKLTFLLLTFLLGLQCMVAQNIRVTGVVVDEENGEPVIGASIMVKGTTQGTITNYDGQFSLDADRNARLLVSYVGMVTQEVPVQADMRISLSADTQALDEVIVVAYGTAKRSSFTGAASVVGAQKIEKRPLTNVTAALEGNAPGVQVTSGLGQPGESGSVRIRGFGSMNASNTPLYVVDGAVYNGSLSDINPADIESMTVLKDGNSTALYGSSAGNGVILITTKKGSGNDGTGVSLNIRQGWSQRAYKDYARVNVWEYYPLQWEMMKNAYITAGKHTASEAASAASAGIANELKYNPFSGIADKDIVGVDGTLNPNATSLKWGDDLDWEDAAFGTGHRQEYNLSYNTKTAKSDTYASAGYLNDKGFMMKTDLERYSGRINYNIYPVKWMKTGLNVAFTRINSNYSTSDQSSSGSYNNLARFTRGIAPIYPVHKHDKETGAYIDANGNPTTDPSQYIYDYAGNRRFDAGRDALAETAFNTRANTRTSQTARTYLTLTPIEGLNITANYALENVDRRRKVYENPLVGDGTAGPGRLNILSTRAVTQTLNQLVSYGKTIGDHTFDVMAGHESYKYQYEYMYAMKTAETVSDVYDFDNFTNISSVTSYTDTYTKEGYLGRINYDYANKYYFSGSVRRDASSRFHKDNRWGTFYSAGASWRISEEEFMKEFSWVDNLKLRASYGETGNDGTLNSDGNSSYYPYKILYGLGYTNGTEAGTYYKKGANQDLLWETQVSTDVALEFGLFDRLTGTIEYYEKASRDLLFPVAQPISAGIPSILRNIGKMKNSGIEITLDYKVLNTRDWNVNVGANWTYVVNKLVLLPDDMRKNGYIDGSKKWLEGKSRYEFWLRQWYGVNPENGDGLFYLDTEAYNDAKGTMTTSVKNSLVEIDGKQLTKNYTYAKYDFSGSSIPKFMGGFNFDISYKGIDLSAIFSYQLGGKILDSTYAGLMSGANYGYSMAEDMKKAWKQPGDITDVPRSDKTTAHNTHIGQTNSTRWLVSSDYLNLRSVTIGYSIPRRLLSPLTLKSARFSLSAENLFMIKARQGLNPQANFTGLTYNEYTPARNITLGLNVSF